MSSNQPAPTRRHSRSHHKAYPIWASWVLLSLPGAYLIALLAWGKSTAADVLEPTGLIAALLVMTALVLAPLKELTPLPLALRQVFSRWQSRYRRALGLAGFGYALLHLALYLVDMQKPAWVLAELVFPSIWTGWLALSLLLLPAAISSNWAMHRLGKYWKRAQRLVYPALILTLLHWWLIEHGFLQPLLAGAVMSSLWLTRVR